MNQDDIYKTFLQGNPGNLTLDPNRGYAPFSRAHLFSNENLIDAFKIADHEGKTVIGITAGADYLLSAASSGARVLAGIDATIFAAFFAELKWAAVRTLSLEDFLGFFCITPDLQDLSLSQKLPNLIGRNFASPFYSPSTYQDLRASLSETARSFFDGIMELSFVDQLGREVPYPVYFASNHLPANQVGHIPYLSDSAQYILARRNSERFSCPLFSVGDIADFSIPKGANIFYVSNVLQYRPRSTFTFINQLKVFLSEGGRGLAFGISDQIYDFEERSIQIKFKSISYRRNSVVTYPTVYELYC